MISKATVSGILSVLFMVVGSVSNAMTPEEKVQFDFVKNTAEQTDPQVVESLKAAVSAGATIDEPGFHKMSEQEIPTIFMTCAIGDAGLLFKGSLGACVSSSGQVYAIGGIGVGVTAGAKASLLMGFVKSSDGSVRGDYSAQIGVGAAAKSIAALLAKSGVTTAGLGFNVIYGYSLRIDTNSDRTLVLAGPAFGLMADLSYSSLTLK
jgi:hypothetical protein